MNHSYCSALSGLLFTGLSLLGVTNANAAGIGFDVRQVCKSVHAIRDDQLGAGIISTHCVVDIRPDNIKETMKERILSGERGAFLPPVLRGNAAALLVLPPILTNDGPPSDSLAQELQAQFAQPFQSLNEAMMAFTGQQDVQLDLGFPPPWTNLPMLAGDRVPVLQSSLSIQRLNAVQQAVIPLPPAAGLLFAGLLMLAGIRIRRQTGG